MLFEVGDCVGALGLFCHLHSGEKVDRDCFPVKSLGHFASFALDVCFWYFGLDFPPARENQRQLAQISQILFAKLFLVGFWILETIASCCGANRESIAPELFLQKSEQFRLFQLPEFRALSCAFVRFRAATFASNKNARLWGLGW